jgi:DNA-binding GntR family transcriptional regulator
VRTAVQALVFEGLLRREPNRTAYVPQLTDDDVLDLYRVRTPIELYAVQTLIEKGIRPLAAEEALARLEAGVAEPTWTEVVDAALGFHRGLIESVESPRLERVFVALEAEVRLCFAQLKQRAGGLPPDRTLDHRMILDAIIRRDAAEATDLMRKHLERGARLSMPAQLELDKSTLTELRASFRGELVRPSDPGYDQHRKIWNGSIDRRPALIARCTGVADVIAAVRFAKATGLEIAVRGGGHSFPDLSLCDGGIVIDLAPMKGIRVDPRARTARAQAGALLGELDRETQEFGLAVPSGIVTHTGVSGLTLGGGIGWIMRKHGLTIDQLVSVDLVTAHGELVKASEDENPDLFWGLRGGGGNFGIVTEFEFRAVPLGPIVLAGPISWAMEDSPDVLRFYRDWIAYAPDELMTLVIHRKAPPLPTVPPELHGKLVVSVICCYAGPVEDGERVVAPLKAFGSPVLDACIAKPYLNHQAMFDPVLRPGWWYYFRACDVAELTDEIIDITVEHSLRIRSPLTSFPIWQMGGAVGRIDEAATAFHGRTAGHTFNISGITEGPEGFDEEREWVRGLWSALEPWHTSVYVNFLMEEGGERIRLAYGDEKYERLKALKRRYDPQNLFHLNQNIAPD